jgi:hypothetical protein
MLNAPGPSRMFEFDFSLLTVMDMVKLREFLTKPWTVSNDPVGFIMLLSKYSNIKPEKILFSQLPDLAYDALFDFRQVPKLIEEINNGIDEQTRLDQG